MVREKTRRSARLALALVCLFPLLACAEVAGTVVNLSGTLSAKDAEGNLRILSTKSELASGETLYTEKGSYARLKFTDGSVVTLRPESQFKVENYHYDQAQPKKDSGIFSLIKGGLRTITGLIGKRGNPDGYQMQSASATIGIRGTHFGALLCQDDCGGIRNASGRTPENGLHVDVSEGSILVSNNQGRQILNTGEFGFVRNSGTPPVVVPAEDGVKLVPPAQMGHGPSKDASSDSGKDKKECD